jgi:hypothetical protein
MVCSDRRGLKWLQALDQPSWDIRQRPENKSLYPLLPAFPMRSVAHRLHSRQLGSTALRASVTPSFMQER